MFLGIIIILGLFFSPTSELSPVDIPPEELLVETKENYLVEIKEISPIISNKTMIPRVKVTIKDKYSNKTLVNLTFKTPEAGYKFFNDGLFLYGYYSGWDSGVRSEAVFLDHNLTPKWWKVCEHNVSTYESIYFNPKTAQEYEGYILMLGSITKGFDKVRGILFFNKTNEEFIKVLPAEGFDLLVMGKKAYLLSSREKYYLTLYDLETEEVIKTIETSIEVISQPIDPFTGVSIDFVRGGNYFALFFSEILAGNGVCEKICIYSLDLEIVGCIDFESHDPQDKNKIIRAMFVDDYLILERNNRKKEVYKING